MLLARPDLSSAPQPEHSLRCYCAPLRTVGDLGALVRVADALYTDPRPKVLLVPDGQVTAAQDAVYGRAPGAARTTYAVGAENGNKVLQHFPDITNSYHDLNLPARAAPCPQCAGATVNSGRCLPVVAGGALRIVPHSEAVRVGAGAPADEPLVLLVLEPQARSTVAWRLCSGGSAQPFDGGLRTADRAG